MSSQSEAAKQNIALWTRLPVVLASASPRRAEILRSAGIPFAVRPVDIDEEIPPFVFRGQVFPLGIAREKAAAAENASGEPECIITADTLVLLDDQQLGKPSDPTEARETLKKLRARTHQVSTGLVVIVDNIHYTASTATSVTFRDYTDAEIDEYIATGSPMDKAGAYGIQDESFAPVADYAGCYLNVVGLPLCNLSQLMGQARVLPKRIKISCEGHRP